MELARSIEIVHALSQGIDPLTGAALPSASPKYQPECGNASSLTAIPSSSGLGAS